MVDFVLKWHLFDTKIVAHTGRRRSESKIPIFSYLSPENLVVQNEYSCDESQSWRFLAASFHTGRNSFWIPVSKKTTVPSSQSRGWKSFRISGHLCDSFLLLRTVKGIRTFLVSKWAGDLGGEEGMRMGDGEIKSRGEKIYRIISLLIIIHFEFPSVHFVSGKNWFPPPSLLFQILVICRLTRWEKVVLCIRRFWIPLSPFWFLESILVVRLGKVLCCQNGRSGPRDSHEWGISSR